MSNCSHARTTYRASTSQALLYSAFWKAGRPEYRITFFVWLPSSDHHIRALARVPVLCAVRVAVSS